MRKSVEQIQNELAELSKQLTEAIERESLPKVEVEMLGGQYSAVIVNHDSLFELDGTKLTITDSDGDAAVVNLAPILSTWPRTETSFVYNGIARKGIVIGLQNGRFTTLVEVLETWNERDGDQDEPTYKLFSSDQIIRSYREKA